MKKRRIFVLLLAAVLLLSACAAPKEAENAGAQEEKSLSGGSFILQKAPVPEKTLWAACVDGVFYTVSEEFSGDIVYHLRRDGAEIYALPGLFYAAAAAPEGIWLLENRYDGENRYVLTLISTGGDTLCSLDLSAAWSGQRFSHFLLYCAGRLVLLTEEAELLALSPTGERLYTAALPDSQSYPVAAGSGQVYAVQETGGGNLLYQIDGESGELTPAFSCGEGEIFNGSGGAFLLLSAEDGLYALEEDGGSRPLVLWAECGLSPGRLYGAESSGEGGWLIASASGLGLLCPVDPSALKPKTALILATVSPDSRLQSMAAAFNYASEDYVVTVVDYSDGGALDAETAKKKLNTEIISGKGPDMLCFSGLSPFPYIRQGLLMDLSPFFSGEEGISLDDLAIAKALLNQGGLYFLSGDFALETMVARYSDFGDRYGWTLEEYLRRESALPEGGQMLNNMTRETFLRAVSARYLSAAIDWDEGTCRFDCPEFISVLETAGRICETPEDADNMNFGFGAAKVAEGSLTAAMSWVDTVWKLAFEEKTAGCALSFIGWPSPEGSCGSDVRLNSPVGVLKGSENPAGCWEFIRFMLENSQGALPVFLPLLRQRVQEAKADETLPVRMTEEDARRLYDLLSAVENTVIYDETVLSIIMQESAAFFDGRKSAAETAALIQSRVGIYVAEQGG